MKTPFKTKFAKTSRWFIGLFVLLFLFRLIYGYLATDVATNADYSDNFFSSIENLRKNYASDKLAVRSVVDLQVISWRSLASDSA